MTLLSVRNVAKRFGGLDALRGVSLDLPAGQTVSVIGPNGAGKTTLFNLIAGADSPDSGEITLDGRRINGLPAHQIAAMGLARTFQNGRVFGNLSVLDNVLLGAHSRLQEPASGGRADGPDRAVSGAGLGRALWGALSETAAAVIRPRRLAEAEKALVEEAKEILSLFGERLLPRLDQPAYSLSYANRRRTELARALALRPKVLLLDEPTAGMNPTETEEMLEVIQLLQKRGHTILLIEHKLDLVMTVSHQVVALDAGQVLVAGRPQEVRTDPRLIEAYVGRTGPTPASTPA